MNGIPHCRAIVAMLLVTAGAGFLEASGRQSDLRPTLPVHVWRDRQHMMGFLAVTESGELRFASLVAEETAETEHPGYWIEAWKVDGLRRICPEALHPFEITDQIVVAGVTYRRVLSADAAFRNSPPRRQSTVRSPLGSRPRQF